MSEKVYGLEVLNTVAQTELGGLILTGINAGSFGVCLLTTITAAAIIGNDIGEQVTVNPLLRKALKLKVTNTEVNKLQRMIKAAKLKKDKESLKFILDTYREELDIICKIESGEYSYSENRSRLTNQIGEKMYVTNVATV